MSEPDKFIDYAAWLKCCHERGDDGPYNITEGVIEQFVRKGGEGTSAIWNHRARFGYVFAVEIAGVATKA